MWKVYEEDTRGGRQGEGGKRRLTVYNYEYDSYNRVMLIVS